MLTMVPLHLPWASGVDRAHVRPSSDTAQPHAGTASQPYNISSDLAHKVVIQSIFGSELLIPLEIRLALEMVGKKAMGHIYVGETVTLRL